MSAVLEALRAGRERVARGWTQGAFARNQKGSSVAEANPSAICFCALGAIYADRRAPYSLAFDALSRAVESPKANVPPHCVVGYFNDDPATTQADVLALYDRAIAANGGA